ncbi:hypothetical protein ACOMHN_063804 [Nucella lapillus]
MTSGGRGPRHQGGDTLLSTDGEISPPPTREEIPYCQLMEKYRPRHQGGDTLLSTDGEISPPPTREEIPYCQLMEKYRPRPPGRRYPTVN